jgi:5-methylcytosine-specific restriction endonuclease McrA
MVTAVLQRPTLVLNRNWQPVGVNTVARSLVKVWNETARIVDAADFRQYTWDDWTRLRPEGDEAVIHTRTQRLRVPEVIVLTDYDRLPSNAVTFSRRNIFKRDRYTCQYCGRQGRFVGVDRRVDEGGRGSRLGRLSSEDLTIDHVVPRSQGGTSTWDNCVLACIDCNARKADRTPEQARMPLRRKPVRPHWRPLYASHGHRIDSWSRFVSEAYWTVELDE